MPESFEIDPLLLPFARAKTEQESERLLSDLISQHAAALVQEQLHYKLRVFVGTGSVPDQETEDVQGEVMLRLLKRLRAMRSDPSSNPIGSFRGYVRVLTSNACADHLRRRFPLRSALQDRLKYLLTHRPQFDLWKSSNDEWICGFSSWKDSGLIFDGDDARRLLENPGAVISGPKTPSGSSEPADLVATIFDYTAAALPFDDLVSIVAAIQAVREREPDNHAEVAAEDLVDRRIGAEAEAAQRQQLERLWREIVELPPKQRFALLMNLRDENGRDVTSLLPLTGVCSLAGVAAVLGITIERLSGILNELPWDDARIAAELGLTRQQVINLRKSARQRLSRRTAGN